MASCKSAYRDSISKLLSLVDHERGHQSSGGSPGVGAEKSANQKQGPRQKTIFDLERIQALLGQLGNPHLTAPTIHVAGTKGKGSTAALCDAALHAAGYSTGFYSSPHLHSFRERVRLNTQPISESQFAALVELVWPQHLKVTAGFDLGPVTLFEFMTAMAFQRFGGASTATGEAVSPPVDFQVIEVGLGGRLDATNLVEPAVCVITSVSHDHTAILGDSLAQIAGEKAGIIKPGSTVVVAPQEPEAVSVIDEVCQRQGARSVHVGRDVTWELVDANSQGQEFTVAGRLGEYHLKTPLLGKHQLVNASTAVATLEVLREQGYPIPTEAIARGFADVSWPCRMEVLVRSPLVVADGAHNLNSVESLLQSLPSYLDYRRLILVAGFSRDKSVEDMVRSLAEAQPVKTQPLVFATASRHPRSLASRDVAGLFAQRGISTVEAASPAQALSLALEAAVEDDLVLATGSLFVAAEVREAVLGIEAEIYPDLLPLDQRTAPSRN